VVASAPASTVAVQAVAGGTDEVDVLNDQIEQQQVDIEYLIDQVRLWRKRCESRAFSTTSNTLHDLLLKLQRVLQLQFDNPDAVYEAVAEAIHAHTTLAQRHQIDDAPSDKYGFIAYLVESFKFKNESSDTADSASESDESDASEQAKDEVDKPIMDGIASNRLRSVVNRATGIGNDKKADMSSLLSDLKHVSETGSSFTNNIGSADADTPPT
jgi:hypothetical protein